MGTAIYTPGADYSLSNMGQITLSDDVIPTALAIQGDTTVLGSCQYSCSFTPVFTNQREVIWSITSGNNYATISETGLLIADSQATSSPVVIRATSSVAPSVYAEKEIVVTGTPVTYYDWLKNNDTAYIIIPTAGLDFGNNDALLISIVTVPEGQNVYIFSASYSTSASGATANQAYNNSSNKISYRLGGSTNNPLTKTTGLKYRYEFDLKGKDNSGSVVRIYNDTTDTLLHTSNTAASAYINSDIGLFSWCVNRNGKGSDMVTGDLFMTGKIYRFSIKKGDTMLLDLRPCSVSGVGAMIDIISGTIYYNYNTVGTFSYGNDE